MNGGVLLLNTKTGEVLASVHPEIFFEQKHPPGSLIKIFSAISYYKDHGDTFPVFHCPPTLASDPNGCWDRNGHGRVMITRAIAYSCNVYFRQLSEEISSDTFQRTLHQFGLTENESEIALLPEAVQRRLMVGNTNDWTVEPILFIRAYCSLYNGGYLWPFEAPSRAPRHVLLPRNLLELIRKGMGIGAVEGTSVEARKAAGAPVLGKTATSLRFGNGRTDWNDTQGWWIGFYPTTQPEVAVMAFARKGRGAVDAAPLGGKALALYLKQK